MLNLRKKSVCLLLAVCAGLGAVGAAASVAQVKSRASLGASGSEQAFLRGNGELVALACRADFESSDGQSPDRPSAPEDGTDEPTPPQDAVRGPRAERSKDSHRAPRREKERPALVIVTGTAQAAAEIEGWRFGGTIEASGEDTAGALAQSAAVLQAVQEAFRPYGRVTEEGFSVYPACNGTGYTAARCLLFVTDGANDLESIRSMLASAGVTHLGGFAPLCANEGEVRQEALRQAAENACRKAEALGCTGRLVRLEELACCLCAGSAAEGLCMTATVRAVFMRTNSAEDAQNSADPASAD